MDTYSIQSSAITTIPASLTKAVLLDKTCLHGQVIRFPSVNKLPLGRKIKSLDIKARASSGVTKVSSGVVQPIPKESDTKDDNLVFVAGATGRVGSRTVRELLKLGFRVRAGVRSAERAQTLVQSVKQLKLDDEGTQPVEKLEIVECDLEKPNEIVPALGNASVVICSIGASEKEVFDISGPYRIDYQATKNLVDAAASAKVKHFMMVSSLGTNKVGFPAAILNLFWGVLIWKRKAEEALIASGIPYTIVRPGGMERPTGHMCMAIYHYSFQIVRPGGMERPTDSFKKTHNITLSEEDTLFGGLVSNLQVAELLAFMAKNRELSYCKVVEVIAETTAPLTPMDKLLTKILPQRPIPKAPSAVGAPALAPAPPKEVVTEAPSASSAAEKPKAAVSTPLSPYTAYPDLKPPTSPTPIPPGAQEKSSSSVEAASKPDFTEAQPSSSEAPSATPEATPAPTEAKKPTPLSPYTAYADLKPPTSPTPFPPGGSTPPTSTNEVPEASNNAPPTASLDQQENTNSKPRPLSPYTMYEDLKPPTSPTPSGN